MVVVTCDFPSFCVFIISIYARDRERTTSQVKQKLSTPHRDRELRSLICSLIGLVKGEGEGNLDMYL